MSIAASELAKKLLLPANVQGMVKTTENNSESIMHNDELMKIKLSEVAISFVVTLASVYIAREINIRTQEIRALIETMCAFGIVAGLTIAQLIDICIFYMRYETSSRKLW